MTHFCRNLLTYKEVRTLYHGAIHSLCPTGEYKLYNGISLSLRKSLGDYELFIYPEGYEFWFNMPKFPTFLNPVKIDSKNDDGIVAASILLSEQVYNHMDKVGSPCGTYSSDDHAGNNRQ